MSSSTSSDLAKGKNFLKKLLYVQHVDKEKDTASEIPDRYLQEFLLADRNIFPDDSNFTEYLKSPNENLSILKSSLENVIDMVEIYSNPLPIRLQIKDVTIHAFVVFTSRNHLNKCTWWSLEKNGQHIVLQQSPEKDDVINKLYHTETKTSVERLGPIKTEISDLARKFVKDLVRIIWDNNELNVPYHLLYSNSQNFASFVFETLSHGKKKWSTGPSAAVDRIGLKKKKIQTGIEADKEKYISIKNDRNFDFYRAMMEGRRKDFEQMTSNLTMETLNSVDSQGYTLLEWATVFSTSKWPIAKKLKKSGAEIPSDQEGLFRRNVFFIGLQYLPPNKKSKLFDSFDEMDINGVNKTGDTALHLALYGEKWEPSETILNKFKDYDVNITNSLGDTPLLLAAKLKHCEIGLFKKILRRTNSENVNKVDENGSTALHYAIDKESEAEVKELLNHNDVDVNVTNSKNETALHLLASNRMGNIPVDLFNLILEKSTDVNAQDKYGWTALHIAISVKSETATKELLKHKNVDVNVKSNINETALLFACVWKDIPIDLFKIILQKSTDVNAQTVHGHTALHLAITSHSETNVREMLKHQDVNIENENSTALLLASNWKDIPADLFKIILDKSTEFNAQNEHGNTALHCAIACESEIATKELLAQSDVNVTIKNNDNETALQSVSKWKDIPSDLLEKIKKRSANQAKRKLGKLDLKAQNS